MNFGLNNIDVNRNQSHRRFISPRPTALSTPSSPPPPVPPVPPVYAGHTSLPIRTNTSSLSATPPVLPIPQGFTISSPRRAPTAGPSNLRNNVPAPQAAPVSHHVPVMGFGGAIITSTREQSTQRAARRSIGAAVPGRRPAHSRAHPAWFHNEDGEGDFLMHVNHFVDDNDFNGFEHARLHHFTHRRPFKETRENDQYRQSYTHPDQPEPGFTFDFAPESEDVPRSRCFPPTSADEPIILDDDDEPSSSRRSGGSSSSAVQETASGAGKLNAVLVCAKCLDPLVLNAGLDPEEGQFRRVWGLRCGHLIDEKCLNELGQPPHQEEEVVVDRKGKGKAKAAPRKHTYGDAVPELQSLADAEVPNIRSRLRSRGSALIPSLFGNNQNGSSSASSSSSSANSDQFLSLPPPPKRRRTNNKKPKVEGEFEWRCPVAHCGRVHVSVKIDGIWGPEKEKDVKGVKGLQTEARGAVAIFA